jgi:hypothetical protein
MIHQDFRLPRAVRVTSWIHCAAVHPGRRWATVDHESHFLLEVAQVTRQPMTKKYLRMANFAKYPMFAVLIE